MKRVWSYPALWLTVIPIALLALALARGQLAPMLRLDSQDYIEFSWSSLETVLSQTRTFAYPLFLQFAGLLGDGVAAVPVGHWGAMVLAVWVFYWGIREAGFCRQTALWCAASLMLGRSFVDLGAMVTPDSLAISLTTAATGCFFAVISRKSGLVGWAGLVLFTFLAYQTRPAYLFLVPLWPILAVVFDCFLFRREAPFLDCCRNAIWVAGAAILPFVLFCTLRWGVVGHWGLVSFGGVNIIGVSGQFLDEDLVRELPSDLQPLARAIDERWTDGGIAQGPRNSSDFLRMEQSYNVMVHQLAVPLAADRYGPDLVPVNRQLSRLAQEIIKRRPIAYLRWLFWNADHARQEILRLVLFDKGTVVPGLILLLMHGYAFLRGYCAASAAGNAMPGSRQRFLENHLLIWTAVGLASAKTLLVILVEPANSRYMTGAMELFPAAVAVWGAHYASAWRCRATDQG